MKTLAVAVGLIAAASSQGQGLVYPVDIVAAEGGYVIADFKAPGLLAIDADGAVRPIVRGEGLPRTPLYGTRAVLEAPDGGGWLVADPGTHALYRISDDGAVATITTELDIPQGLVPFDEQSVLVSDLRSGFGAVLRVSLDGRVNVFAEIDSPKGIVVDGDGGFVVVSHGQRAVHHLGRDGSIRELHRGPPLDFPHDLVRLADGSFVISDGYASALFRMSPDGELSTFVAGPPLVNPQGIALGPDGTLVVVDPQAGAIFRVAPDGGIEPWVEVAGR